MIAHAEKTTTEHNNRTHREHTQINQHGKPNKDKSQHDKPHIETTR